MSDDLSCCYQAVVSIAAFAFTGWGFAVSSWIRYDKLQKEKNAEIIRLRNELLRKDKLCSLTCGSR